MRRKSFTASLLLAGALAATAVSGQASPRLGAELEVNETTPGTQSSPALAFSPETGNYLAIWTGPDHDQVIQVFGRLLNSAGVPQGGEFQISSGFSTLGRPRVAAGGGGFAVVWIDLGVVLRRYDEHGVPLGDPVRLDPAEQVLSCDVAVNAAGDILVIWSTGNLQDLQGQVFARRVSSRGEPGNTQAVSPFGLISPVVRVAAAPDLGFLTVWESPASFLALWLDAERVDSQGNWAPPFQVNESNSLDLAADVRPLFRPDGGFDILWRSESPFGVPPHGQATARSWDAAGNPLTHDTFLDFEVPVEFDAARDLAGNTLVFTADGFAGAHGRLFDSSWQPVTADIVFQGPLPAVPMLQPAVAVDPGGNFLALWTVGAPILPPFTGDSNILGRPLEGPLCLSGSETLCLGPAGRFQAHVAWTNPFTGETGTGRTLQLTPDTGAFWFFGDQNLELMVKVLDGTAVNGHFWVYAGALSNVEYTLTVTDTLTGSERSYHNPPFQFASRADVEAFPAAATGAETAPVALPAALALGPPTTLALAGHFTVSVLFTDPRTGNRGPGFAVPLTADTGAFWFFGNTNLELMVKVLDGRAINGKFWVFFGALSDVDYTLTVTDTQTGKQQTYHNSRGTLASHADTAAF